MNKKNTKGRTNTDDFKFAEFQLQFSKRLCDSGW